jgi:hypothetical protein
LIAKGIEKAYQEQEQEFFINDLGLLYRRGLVMALLVEQLVYTSFPEVGFKLLTSGQISTQLRQVFLEMVVNQYWDAYNPPPSDYQAAFLRQLDRENSLFGWLYNDVDDDFGRINIPYFICYYCDRTLDCNDLNNIFNCLQKGPITKITRHNSPPHSLELIYIPDIDSYNYQPNRVGIDIPLIIRQHSLSLLEQNQLLNLLIPGQSQSFQVIEIILQNAIARKFGILGAVLVTKKGQFLTEPINIPRKTVVFLVDFLRDLSFTQQHKFLMKSQNGYLVLSMICSNVFLLVETELVLKSVLLGEFENLVNKLRAELAIRSWTKESIKI